MRHKEFIHGRSLFHFPKKCLLSEGLFFTSRCLKCVSRVSVASVSMTTFLRNDETQRIQTREISPPLSKKVPCLRGSVFYVSMPKICFACLSTFQAYQWLLFPETMRHKELIQRRSLLHSPKKYLVSEGLFRLICLIIVSLSHFLSHWLKFLH